MINQLPPSDEAFKGLSGSFFHHLSESFLNEKNEKSQKLAILLFVVILAYAGVEAVKLFFRNNFGKKGIDVWKLILSFGAFVAIGIFAFSEYSSFGANGDYSASSFGTKDSYLYTSVFYFGLALMLLVKGWIEVKKRATNEVHPSYRGNSTILGFLVDSGWSQAKVQNLAEPILVLAIGIFLTPINFLLGIPLIFCAISVWIHYAYEALRGLLNARNDLSDNKGYSEQYEQSFSEVMN